jgi:hypothetical protein
MVTSRPAVIIADDDLIHVTEQSSLAGVDSPIHPLRDGPVYTSVWRGILLVEPDIALLTEEVLLLNRSNYCVTPAYSQGEIFALRGTKAIALAILSDSLGPRILAAVAQTVRKQWPLARILILGRPASMLEDHLYDEEMSHSSDPKQLIEDVERLYKDSWNQRSHMLDWNVKHSSIRATQSPICESDPTKTRPLEVSAERALRDKPSGIKYRPQ